ncbi:MAG: glycosyl hydrolase-related protein [Armatimonadetes bacterium]|nr:glycosyl hydrolase-related protein [Armatimonadota bacterium]
MPYIRDQRRRDLEHLGRRIADVVYITAAQLDIEAWQTAEPVPFAERTSGARITPKPGDKWGGLFDCAWFHFTGAVPAECAGKPVALLVDLSGEGLVVDAQGEPRLGLTNVSSGYDHSLGNPGKRVVPVTDCAAGGEAIDLWVDAGCNDLFGELRDKGTVREARIVTVNPNLRALSYDCEVLGELMLQLPEGSARRHRIWDALDRAAGVMLELTEANAAEARAILAPELAKRGGDASLTVSAIGHAHIDLAWLWPLRETYRKGARTFATVLELMDRYPDFVFGASQPQLYDWMKRMHPRLYERIKQRVAEGRWEVQGCMWVEADANVPSGESLARQILYGKRFYREEFGIDVKGLWLPDVFGYSGALPQLLRKAGCDWFMTQKLSWNTVNRMPHHTFRWKGIDGSEVLAHTPPEDTYNSSAAPRAIAKAEREFHDKAVSDECLVLFGIGDGGGGPGEEHLERLLREKDLAGLSPVVQEPSQAFFERILRHNDRLRGWAGELYLERHQGTYTTQARNKQYNRRMEQSLQEAEFACVLAQASGTAYPAAEIEEIWKETLLYQFHDILPGSSIGRVYAESLARYADLLARTQALTASALTALTATIDAGAAARPALVMNAGATPRTGWSRLADGGWVCADLPALACTVVDLDAAPQPTPPTVADNCLDNGLVHARFDTQGRLESLVDLATDREMVQPGQVANRLALYHDQGDAWDMPFDYQAQPAGAFELVSCEPFADGPAAGLRMELAYGASRMVQKAFLTQGSPVLEFDTWVDWRETGKMLRAQFPTTVVTPEATCEIQFGSIKRPTHTNTTWDAARFEVCAQRWVDLSDRGAGLALLNNCKYGHRLDGSTLDLNLLRSPGYPDPTADRAEHCFRYGLYPHTGDVVEARVGHVAAAFNMAPVAVPMPAGQAGAPAAPLLRVTPDSVIVDSLKRAEDGRGLIVRLHEAAGASCTAEVALAAEPAEVRRTNLVEDDQEKLDAAGGSIRLPLGPFTVETLRIIP